MSQHNRDDKLLFHQRSSKFTEELARRMDATQRLEDTFLEEEDKAVEERNSGKGREPLAKLRVFNNEHFPETEFPLFLGENVLGRDPASCSLLLSARSVSKRHAVISLSLLHGNKHRGEGVMEALLWDLGSMNGTRRGRFRLTPHVRYALGEGESVLIADLPCQFVRVGEGGAGGNVDTPSKTETGRGKGTLRGVAPGCVSDSDSEREISIVRERRAKLFVPDSESPRESRLACSSFLTPTSRFVLDSEEESSITASSSGRLDRSKTGKTPRHVSDSDPDEEEASRDRSAADSRINEKAGPSGALPPAGPCRNEADFKIRDSESDSDTKESAGVKATSVVDVKPSSDPDVRAEEFHLDSDTDVEEEANSASSPAEERVAKPPPAAPTVQPIQFHLDSDVDTEDRGEDPSGLASRESSSQPKAAKAMPQELHYDSDTDTEEADAKPEQSMVAMAQGLEILSDSGSDADDDSVPPSAPVTAAQQSHSQAAVPGAAPAVVAACPETDSDTDLEEFDSAEPQPPAKSKADLRDFNLDSDTDVEDEQGAQGRVRHMGEPTSSTPVGSAVREEELETQAFICSSDPFRRPTVPPPLKAKPHDDSQEDSEEDLMLAATQCFVSEGQKSGPPGDLALEATQPFSMDPSLVEEFEDQPTQAFSFQLGVSHSCEATQPYDQPESGEESDLETTQAYGEAPPSKRETKQLERDEEERYERERLEKEKNEREEQERLEKEKEEKERLEKEKREEEERLELEKKEWEENQRLEKEAKQREEKERLAREMKEREENERLEKEQKEREERKRLEQEKEREEMERLEKERKEREEKEKLEKQRKEMEEIERLKKEKRDREEKERLEKEREEKEEKERLQKEQMERERLEKEKKEEEERERQEKERKEQEERERQEKERKEQEARERQEKEKKEQEVRERQEKEKKEQEVRERQEKERKEQEARERQEKEKKEQEARERQEKERKEQEARERLEKEKKEQEARERLEKEKKEQEARERLEKEKKEQEVRERLEKEKKEQEVRERQEKERKDREEKERLEKEKKEREEKEKQEKERKDREEKERLEREKKEGVLNVKAEKEANKYEEKEDTGKEINERPDRKRRGRAKERLAKESKQGEGHERMEMEGEAVSIESTPGPVTRSRRSSVSSVSSERSNSSTTVRSTGRGRRAQGKMEPKTDPGPLCTQQDIPFTPSSRGRGRGRRSAKNGTSGSSKTASDLDSVQPETSPKDDPNPQGPRGRSRGRKEVDAQPQAVETVRSTADGKAAETKGSSRGRSRKVRNSDSATTEILPTAEITEEKSQKETPAPSANIVRGRSRRLMDLNPTAAENQTAILEPSNVDTPVPRKNSRTRGRTRCDSDLTATETEQTTDNLATSNAETPAPKANNRGRGKGRKGNDFDSTSAPIDKSEEPSETTNEEPLGGGTTAAQENTRTRGRCRKMTNSDLVAEDIEQSTESMRTSTFKTPASKTTGSARGRGRKVNDLDLTSAEVGKTGEPMDTADETVVSAENPAPEANRRARRRGRNSSDSDVATPDAAQTTEVAGVCAAVEPSKGSSQARGQKRGLEIEEEVSSSFKVPRGKSCRGVKGEGKVEEQQGLREEEPVMNSEPNTTHSRTRSPVALVKKEQLKKGEEVKGHAVQKTRRGKQTPALKKEEAEEDEGRDEVSNEDAVSAPSSEEQDAPRTPTGKNVRKRAAPSESPSAAKIARGSMTREASPGGGGRTRALTQAYKVLFTGVTDPSGEAVVPRLGGSLAKGVNDMTHLVTDKVRRTVKFLCAVARGIPIVTTNWLEKSGKQGSFLPPSEFLVKDVEQEQKFSFCLEQSLSAAQTQPLLQGYEIHVTRSVKPEPAQMKDIITCSGARYLPKMPTVLKPDTVVVSCTEDASLCTPALSASIPVVSAEFLLSGILQQRADPVSHALSGPGFKQGAPGGAKGGTTGKKKK
ncbi:hypothetical protein GJAV_G00006190 [Gymnothorax javanicus]|nr:hypothetical protein GJAV_G00006190 [Gymnothorax javanicus]